MLNENKLNCNDFVTKNRLVVQSLTPKKNRNIVVSSAKKIVDSHSLAIKMSAKHSAVKSNQQKTKFQ